MGGGERRGRDQAATGDRGLQPASDELCWPLSPRNSRGDGPVWVIPAWLYPSPSVLVRQRAWQTRVSG